MSAAAQALILLRVGALEGKLHHRQEITHVT
jgi:hypothetical protein